MTPEFSRPERAEAIGINERTVTIAADEGERQRLARRFAILSIEQLEATLSIRREATGIVVQGRVTGAVTQACSATGEPLLAPIDEPVALRFVDALDEAEEVELSAEALDTLPIEGGIIDLGEAAAETMALALDPFPRAPDAAAKLAEAGVLGEAEADVGPFGALADLKRRLSGE